MMYIESYLGLRSKHNFFLNEYLFSMTKHRVDLWGASPGFLSVDSRQDWI